MKYLAIDLGLKRTGLAVGDDITCIVTPVDVLEISSGPQLNAAIIAAAKEHGAHAFVMGLPLNMDGTEGLVAKYARAVGDQISSACGLPVHVQDERLSSFDAEQSLNQSGLTHKQKKELRDALAAAAILKDFLASRKISSTEGP